MKMGAKTIIDRNEFLQDPIKPMDKALYSSAVDTVGGNILAKTLTMVSNHGVVSCCGNVAGASFTSSVFPFILRGIQLCGIDSAESSIELKKELWDLLSDSWSLDLTNQTKIVDLNEIDKEIESTKIATEFLNTPDCSKISENECQNYHRHDCNETSNTSE